MTKLETAICVWAEFDGDYAHIKGYICKNVLNADGMPQCVDRYDHPYYSVRLHSQANRGYQWTGMYGMEVAVDCYDRISLRDAKKAVDTLTPIMRKLEKMRDAEGETKSYGQWLNRVARAMGAKTVFFKRVKAAANRSQYLGVSGGDIMYRGDALEAHVAEWANPETKQAA